MTRVVVAGGGSIGSLFAAHLARVAEVTVLTPRSTVTALAAGFRPVLHPSATTV